MERGVWSGSIDDVRQDSIGEGAASKQFLNLSALTSVNQTALLVALRRASESQRPDALFCDVLAETLEMTLTRSQMSATFWSAYSEMENLSGDAVALRTRFYDDQINLATARGVRQIVLLGAGLDGRSSRLNVPSDTRFFEIDEGAILELRWGLLAEARISSKYIAATISARLPADDLAERLFAVGFRSDVPTVFVAEGLIFYLPQEDRKTLISSVNDLAAPGSLLLADYPARQALVVADDSASLSVTADFDPEATPDPWSLLPPPNWIVNAQTLSGLAESYGRSLPIQIDESRGGARWWYLNAIRA